MQLCKVRAVELHVKGMEAIIAESAVGAAADGGTQSPGGTAVSPAAKARFVTVYTREYPRIVAYARRRTGDLHSAEDIAVEVFRIAWEQLTSGGVPSTGWLFVTARNLLHTHHRLALRTGRLRHKLEQEREREADELRGEPVERMLDALDRLPAEQRELLMAHYWDDLSGADCAALVGCSVGAVWVRLHRARAALRHQIQNLEDGSPCD